MREFINSPELQQKLIPNWELGCRRITPGLPYLQAVQEPNVNVIRSDIRRITKDGIETVDGQEHRVDTIICATGFNTSFVRFELIGRGGKALDELWKDDGPQGYLGLGVAGLPNYFSKFLAAESKPYKGFD
jgi:cation diffusion facilitator CzcD-associated flavoprotein CzcO